MNKRIREKIELALESHKDIEVVDIRFSSDGGNRLIQVLLDREGGIDLGILTEINRNLSKEMDTWDIATGTYFLEVSSAGLERPLTKLQHFSRFTQRKVKILLHKPAGENRKRYTGIIRAVHGEMVNLETDVGMMEIPYANIRKANLVFEMKK